MSCCTPRKPSYPSTLSRLIRRIEVRRYSSHATKRPFSPQPFVSTCFDFLLILLNFLFVFDHLLNMSCLLLVARCHFFFVLFILLLVLLYHFFLFDCLFSCTYASCLSPRGLHPPLASKPGIGEGLLNRHSFAFDHDAKSVRSAGSQNPPWYRISSIIRRLNPSAWSLSPKI